MFPVLALSLVWTGNVATAKKPKFDPTSVSNVALFSMAGTVEIEQAETRSGVGVLDAARDLKKTKDAVSGLKDGSMKAESGRKTIEIYDTVEQGLEGAFDWEVWDYDTLSSHDAYAAAWDTFTPKKGRGLAGWGGGMAPEGILHNTSTLRLKQRDRDPLIEALGVDALVMVDLTVAGKDQGVRIGGVGTSRVKPRTTAIVTIYVPGEKKHVWRGGVTGEKTEEAIKNDMGAEDDGRHGLILASIQNAMTKLGEKYTE